MRRCWMEQVLFLHGHENPCKWYRLHRLQHVATAFGIVLGLATLYFSTGERRKELGRCCGNVVIIMVKQRWIRNLLRIGLLVLFLWFQRWSSKNRKENIMNIGNITMEKISLEYIFTAGIHFIIYMVHLGNETSSWLVSKQKHHDYEMEHQGDRKQEMWDTLKKEENTQLFILFIYRKRIFRILDFVTN